MNHMKNIAYAVTEWARGNRPSVMITVEADRHGRTTLVTWAIQMLVWAVPSVMASDRIGSFLIAAAVTVPVFLVLSRAIYVGPAVTDAELAELTS